MIRVRPYESADRGAILSWIGDEREFYLWSAGRIGDYPPDPSRFDELESITRFTAEDDVEPVGFFTVRKPEGSDGELRFGFVIVDPASRCRGVGGEMLTLGLRRAFDDCGADRVSIGVFDDNLPAIRLYKRLGFRETGERETYPIMGETWTCLILSLDRASFGQSE